MLIVMDSSQYYPFNHGHHRSKPEMVVTKAIREALAARLESYRQPEYLSFEPIRIHVHDNKPKHGNVSVEIIPDGYNKIDKPASYMTDYLAMTRVLGELYGASAALGKPAAYTANGRSINFSSLVDLGRAVQKLGMDIDLSPIGEKTI